MAVYEQVSLNPVSCLLNKSQKLDNSFFHDLGSKTISLCLIFQDLKYMKWGGGGGGGGYLLFPW